MQVMEYARTTSAGRLLAIGWLATGLASLPDVASAHPHVWVRVETTVLYSNGTITGFRHKWTFDEFYTAMAIQGLDTNKDGIYSREELAELAQVNIDGLKEFAFFTHPRLGEQALALEMPKDYWLEHGTGPRPAGAPSAPLPADGAAQPVPEKPKEQAKPGLWSRLTESLFGKSDPKPEAEQPVGTLSLHFTLPLKQPVLAEAPDFSFAVYDPSFFIAFDLAEATPVKLGDGAPPGCKVELGQADDAQQRLGDAFQQQLGVGVAGYSATRPIKIICGPRT